MSSASQLVTRTMKNGKRKAREAALVAETHILFNNKSVKRVHYTTTTNTGSSTQINTLGRIPTFQGREDPTVIPDASQIQESLDSEHPGPDPERKRTQVGHTSINNGEYLLMHRHGAQNGQLLDDFGEHFDDLGRVGGRRGH